MFDVFHHGSSGRWYRSRSVATLLEAIELCKKIKADGYGVRVSLFGTDVIWGDWQASIVVKVLTRPTLDMPEGVLYRVVDAESIYWGTFKVVTTWTGARVVLEAGADELIESHASVL